MIKNDLSKILLDVCPDMDGLLHDFLVYKYDKLKSECFCPYCETVHSPYNGTGPEEFEILSLNVGTKLRWVLKFIPWDVWIQRTAVPFHDWMSTWGAECGITFEQCNEIFRRLVELDVSYYYKKKTKNMWWPRRTYWRGINSVLLSNVDEICKYFVGSDQTREDYNTTSCRNMSQFSEKSLCV